MKRVLALLLICVISLSSFAFAENNGGTEFTPILLPELYSTTSDFLSNKPAGVATLFLDAQLTVLGKGEELTSAAFYKPCYLSRKDSIVTAAFCADDNEDNIFIVVYDVRRKEGLYAFLDTRFEFAERIVEKSTEQPVYEVNGSDWTELLLQYLDALLNKG